MRPAATDGAPSLTIPVLLDHAVALSTYAKSLTASEIHTTMHVSEKLAHTTRDLIQSWSDKAGHQRAAIDSFLGDIYSGMQVGSWTEADLQYADQHLRILSGMYGILRPRDGIYPYRLEMGYKLPDPRYKNLYRFWGDEIAKTLPTNEPIIDLTAVEYGKTVTQYVDAARIIAPRFLTISPKTGEPIFVVVHAKIARGAFASWLIRHRIADIAKLKTFDELGYVYNAQLSTDKVPVFVCAEFGGIGLSVRLT